MGSTSADLTITVGACWCGHDRAEHVPICDGVDNQPWCLDCWADYADQRAFHGFSPNGADSTASTLTVAVDA